jgi:methylenetetrahydrofolate reductase (NADPH)
MKIKDILNQRDKVFSFEFFPPKTEAGETSLFNAISELKKLSPDFVSVTYGAFGSSQDKSLEIIKRIHEDIKLEVMAHYTCIGASQEKVKVFLEQLRAIGVRNVLALRGDAPLGTDIRSVLRGAPFKYACDLTDFIHSGSHDFSIGVAGYPEGHPESLNIEADILNLKRKVDSGADFVITQVFFSNDYFYKFRDTAESKGIKVPIIPGIMPIENFKQIEKIISMCGSTIPQELRSFFTDDTKSEEEKHAFGIDFTTRQCQDLLKKGAKGIHFYTLNKSSATREIFERLHVK